MRETLWKVCFKCKRTTVHLPTRVDHTICTVCAAVRDDSKTGARLPIYNRREIGVLCDDGTRQSHFPILIG
jgi:hypothetical protein